MEKRLSFAYVNTIDDNIAEVIIDNNVIITLEMIDEYDEYLSEHFKGNFGLLINRINHYSYTFEAKLTIGSNDGLCAMAVVYYNRMSKESTLGLMNTRVNDDFNLKLFSGLELGKQTGVDWLKTEIDKHNKA
jgi:hypothetical protein